MKGRLILAAVAVAAAAGSVVPAGVASATDPSGGACTDLDRAIDYHAWRAGTTDANDNSSPEAIGSQRYLNTLYRWYHQNNCNVALGKNRPANPPCYLVRGCGALDGWPESPSPKAPVLE